MAETNKTYRVRTSVGEDNYLNVLLDQDYDAFDILSVSINSADVYKLHNANYGVVVGRVYANGGFGVPNAKISIFISVDSEEGDEIKNLYPYTSSSSKDNDGVRYNLLPDEQVSDCHQVVGTFPNKRYLLDNDVLLEVFEKYYKFTTRTNNSGDYLICGVPTGTYTLHMDLDLSDCGILSQRPRDFVYKGYTIEQFENPNQFKKGTDYESLSQIFSQDQAVNVQPFWGNSDQGETIGITRADISIAFKFEPTCVFIGSVASDNASQGISKKCIPTAHMGDMDELTTGQGTIEMIRKTYGGSVEEFQIKGTELINEDGIWCYQIPMNLDYMTTDEYGNMVPTDNPDKGIPTRTRVRFRISMQDMEENTDNFFRAKALVPHNPKLLDGTNHEDYDYEFGTYTKDESFRDLFWNNVYSVKSYIPRFQKRKVRGWKETKFTGIKHCQDYGANNPIPYNNIRIKMPFMFIIMCLLIKIFIKVTAVINMLVSMLGNVMADIGNTSFLGIAPFKKLYGKANGLKMNVIDEGLCPDLENWYFAPLYTFNGAGDLWAGADPPRGYKRYNLLEQTYAAITNGNDPESVDDQNQDTDDEATCLTINTDYLIACVEMNLAQEYKVINFDFYNDWINGLIYFPRWMRFTKKKKRHGKVRLKVKACMDDTKIFSKTRKYTQLCSLGYNKTTDKDTNTTTYSTVKTNLRNKLQIIKSNNFHKKRGFTQVKIFGKNGGICHEKATLAGEYVYYMKPCEWQKDSTPLNRKVNLFATDIILLGSLNDCDLNGIPQAFKHLSSSSYIMPTNLALTNMETNGPLYAYGDKGTICSKQNQTSAQDSTSNNLTGSVNTLSNSSLTAELKFYSGASENYDTQYDDGELSDTMPVTEAAGISWNWSGPGQGEIKKKQLYYPGGHFLGISCVNAQTNIKSCVNLERICEAGSSMSQRKEDIRTYDDTNLEVKYVYSVPTGLISGDDILDDDFRTMFATMNHNRLIATKINPDTGYRMYDFSFVRPNNFNGELSKYTKVNTEYNTRVEVDDESADLSKFGIGDAKNRDDYDPEESVNTQRRTIEDLSLDYYMFRLGISYDEVLKSKNVAHTRRFATSKNGAMYLPQYENSFYFYFGMHNGATAIDEFKEQFFSQCQTRVLSTDNANIVVTEVSKYEPCLGYGVYDISIQNMEPNYTYIIYKSNGEIRDNGISLDGEIREIKLSADTYTIKVIDDDIIEATTTINVGGEYLLGEIVAYDFNVTQTANTRGSGGYTGETPEVGGYVAATDVGILNTNISKGHMRIVGKTEDGQIEGVYLDRDEGTGLFSGELYLSRAFCKYDIYITYACDGSNTWVEMYAGSCSVKNTNELDLTMGDAYKIRYIGNPDYSEPNVKLSNFSTDIKEKPNKPWWQEYTGGKNAKDNENSWMIRHCILDEELPGTSFSSNITAVKGTKAIFGTPQNSESGYVWPTNMMFTSEAGENSYAGYSVDDDASYTYTYGVPYFSAVNQYYAMTYSDTMVCGNFEGVVKSKNDDERKEVTAYSGGFDKLKMGCGCILKPLPYGDLIFGYMESKTTMRCLGSAEDNIDLAQTGIVYPTFMYPVIKKPFTVTANFFRISDKKWSEETTEGGDTIISVDNGITDNKVEGIIRNGLTYKGNMSSSSTMTLYDFEDTSISDKKFYDHVLKGIGNEGDFSITGNLISNSSSAREKTFCNYVSEYTADDYSYSVVEGYPPMIAETFANTRENQIDCVMYSGITYITSEINKDEGGFVFLGEGKTDSDVKYFIVSGIPSDIISVGNIYNYYRPNKRNVYIYATYESGATFDKVGNTCIIHIKDKGANDYAYIPFTDGDGNVVYKSYKMKHSSIFDNNITEDNIRSYVSKLFDKYGLGGKISVPPRREIKDNFKDGEDRLTKLFIPVSGGVIPEAEIKFKKSLSSLRYYCYKGNKGVWSDISLDGTAIDNMLNPSDGAPTGYIVGLKQKDSGTASEISLSTIYLYPVKKRVDETVNNIDVSNSEYTIGSSSGSVSATVSLESGATKDVTWTAKTDADFITFDTTDGTYIPKTGGTKRLTIIVAENTSETPRTATITVYNVNEDEYYGSIITITQKGKQTSTDDGGNTDSGGGTDTDKPSPTLPDNPDDETVDKKKPITDDPIELDV